MGHAHKSPGNGHRYRYFITDHAVERLRERSTKDIVHLDHRDACRWLDTMVSNAIDANQYDRGLDEGEPCKIAVIHDSSGTFYALVKPNHRADARRTEAVVTVLTAEQVQAGMAIDKWEINGTRKRLQAKAFADLGTMDIPLAERPSGPPPGEEEPPAHKPVQTVLISFRLASQGAPGERKTEEYPADEAPRRIQELLAMAGVDSRTIRVWKQVPFQTQVTLEL